MAEGGAAHRGRAGGRNNYNSRKEVLGDRTKPTGKTDRFLGLHSLKTLSQTQAHSACELGGQALLSPPKGNRNSPELK